MKCPICTEDNLDGAIYCEECGGRLPAGTDEPPESPPAEPPVAKYCETCGRQRPAASAEGSGAPQNADQAGGPGAADPAVPAIGSGSHLAPAAQPALIPGGTVRCTVCDRENPANLQYCEDCGKDLHAGQAPVHGAEALAVLPQPSYCRLALASGGKDFPLAGDVIIIGRRSPADGLYPDVDLADDDPESYISRRHAQVIRSGSQYLFEDLGSGNGSFINRMRIVKGDRQVLKDGDRLILGKTEMIFRT